ncbi:MAG TPA: RHS repeat-associated core domain-containing protein [Streptosporangiaceae bacterium]|nr:RHS repeat-associated core domain-containing protein [Streptosporangiaceae bacterium]
MTSWAKRWASGGVRLALIAGLGMSMSGFAAQAAPAASAGPAARHWRPAPQKVKVLPRALLHPTVLAHRMPKVPEGPRPARTWPVAGTANLTFGQRGRGAGAAGPAVVPGARVRVFGQAQARRLGISGVVLKVSATAGPGGLVSVGLDYSKFANAVGGDFADRLHLVELPACALTTPRVARCQRQTPVDSSLEPRREVVSGAVMLGSPGQATMAGPAARLVAPSAGRSVVLAAVSGPSGSNGDFTVSSLSPKETWAGGGAAGDFTWSYPIQVPDPAAGIAPTVALDYDSSSVDGRVASTNNQFGMVGEGFTLSSDNYIERTYPDCADDPEGAVTGKFDDCWAGQVVTMSLNGASTPLVINSDGTWHEQADNGDRVQYLTGTAADTGNGTHDNGYWVVTTPDGTRYFFGKNKGPGWATGDAVTNSAFTAPVYGPHSGDPCFSSSGFGSSSCPQAWRWNLDFVIDANGNAMAYYYHQETNYYGANGATTGVQYVRGGYLTHIDYGLRDEAGSIYGPANAPDQVVFNPDQRCIPTSTFACNASQFTSANAANWPDTPFDQQCLSGATCNNHSPTFWSQSRIDKITTQYWNGTTYVPVDVYSFGQGFSTQGDPELILNSITRTGFQASGTSLALPPVQLSYQLMDNRIPGVNALPSMAHWRLTKIEEETGELISATYSTGCTAAQIPADPSTNRTLCYPVKWAQPGDQNTTLDYFDKYLVSQVEVQDGTTGDPAQLTKYSYIGNPAWHYDDNEVLKAKDRTWGQFRGFAQVNTLFGNTANTTNGTADAQALTETRYFPGMNGDTTATGGTTSGVTVTDSLGNAYTDANALAGQELQTQTFNGNGGPEISAAITVPSVVATTATRTRTGLPPQQATMVRTSKQATYADLAGGGTQQRQTVTTYDSAGRAVLDDQSGTGIPQTCTQTTYDDNTTAWLRDPVSEVIVASQACPATPGNLTAADIIKDTRTYYDGSTSLTAAPTAGNPTMVTEATANNAGTLTFATQSTNGYDASGRVTSSGDGRGDITTTAYTPAGGGPLTQFTTTNALGQTATKVLDPGRGSVLSETDAAGYLTTATYDPLGRLTAQWDPGRSQANNDAASTTYSYAETQAAPLAVTTNTLVDYGTGTNYVTSVAIYDSLGQPRQTQIATEGGDTVVTDSFYDSHGWTAGTNNKYVVTGNPSSALVTVAPSAVDDRTISTYDGAGRVINQQDYNGTTLTDSTQTVYGGNQVTTIDRDPAGTAMGTPSATVTNVLGQPTEQIQYAGAPTVTGSVITGGSPQVTTIGYDAAGDKISIKDPAANTWSYTYDLLGQQTKAVDPDAGTTITGYDAAGNVAFTTNGAGVSDNFLFDGLNRKTAAYTGSTTQGSGTQIATWTWDTLKKGLLSSQTSVTGGVSYKTGMLGYNSAGDVTGTFVTVPVGQPLAGTYRTQYAYSTTGLMRSMTPAAAGGLPVESITYAYDKFGNPVSESGFDKYASGAVWTPFGEISQIELGSGPSSAALTYSYDPQTRNVTGINLSDQQPSPQVDNVAYSYNADQQITQIADTQGATGAPVEDQCFSYDGLSRLTAGWTSSNACATNPATAGNGTVTGPEPYWQSWTFDPEGDILSATSHAPAGQSSGDTTTTYHYAAAGHAHAVSSTSVANTVTGSLPATSFGYDGAGDTTTLGSQTLTWDPNGQLATAGTATAASSYVYNADGDEIAEADTSGGTTTTTLYLPDEQLTTDGTTTTGERYYSFAGKVIGETSPTTLYWLAGTNQGTMTTAVAAFSQSTVVRRASTPYGTMLTGSGVWPDNKGFLGDPAHSAIGLVDVGARKYDPVTSLFISVDPILSPANPQTMTGYTYAADNPVTGSDPSGTVTVDDNGYVVIHPYDGGGGGCSRYCDGNIPIGRVPKHSAYSDGTYTNNGYVGYGHVSHGGGGFHMPHWLTSGLHKVSHVIYHALPMIVAVATVIGCSVGTDGAGLVAGACFGAGFAVYGYLHSAIDSGKWASGEDFKAAADGAAFGACIAVTAAACAGVSVGATAFDYGTDVHANHEWGGANLLNAGKGLALDAAGFGAGKFFEKGIDAGKVLEKAGSVRALFAGGGSMPLRELEPGAFGFAVRLTGRLTQTGLTNLGRGINYLWGRATCVNPIVCGW